MTDLDNIDPAALRDAVQRACATTIAPRLKTLAQKCEEAAKHQEVGASPGVSIAHHVLHLLEHAGPQQEPENADFYSTLASAVREHAHARYPDHGFGDDDNGVTVTAKSGASISFRSAGDMRAWQAEHRGTPVERQWFSEGHRIEKGMASYQ